MRSPYQAPRPASVLVDDELASVEGGDATDGNFSDTWISDNSEKNSDKYSHNNGKGNTSTASGKTGEVTDSYNTKGSGESIDSGKVIEGPVNSGKTTIE